MKRVDMSKLPTLKMGNLSRLINRLAGGAPGQTLCARVAAAYGPGCLFCRVVALFTEPDHCAVEMALDANMRNMR